MRQPISGPGRPGRYSSAAGAEVGVDLAGDVSLQQRMISFSVRPSLCAGRRRRG